LCGQKGGSVLGEKQPRQLGAKENAAMDGRYVGTVQAASAMIVEALLTNEGEELLADPSRLDERVRELVRAVGWRSVRDGFDELVERLVAARREPGMAIQKSPAIKLATVFGHVPVRSPYLRDKQRPGACLRPVKSQWKLHHRGRTRAVERALCDFGAEESFAQASKRFEEHYGFAIERTTVLRVVEAHARRAESYVQDRLDAARDSYDEPLAMRPGAERMLVEIDGCEIRTGVLEPAPVVERCPVRTVNKRVRKQAWRDVRVGFARVPEEVERSYVARMDSYPVAVGQLFSAACERGLSTRTQTTCVADGGNGLSEEVAAQFPAMRFVLDRPHAKHHLYETAETIGLCGEAREAWVAHHIKRLDAGDVDAVLVELRTHKGRGKRRVRRLIGYITRFRDAFGYDAIHDQGLPMASGEVESAHRVIPQKRLKLPGAWWHPDTVNPMLALRVLRANDWWGDFWQDETA
jgi:hypothetical protein